MDLKKLRDSIVHPKADEDSISIDVYQSVIENGLKSIISLLNKLSKGIFGRPLRRTLLDLFPSQ